MLADIGLIALTIAFLFSVYATFGPIFLRAIRRFCRQVQVTLTAQCGLPAIHHS